MTALDRQHSLDRCQMVLDAMRNFISEQSDLMLDSPTFETIERALDAVTRRALEEWVEGVPRTNQGPPPEFTGYPQETPPANTP